MVSEGLWFGRLGGTNLFDAVLPEIDFPRLTARKRLAMPQKLPGGFYFLNRRNEPALLRTDCVHHGRASAA